ncbi:MAG: hypothetical protein KGN36_04730, partial [Acidobacteriota bacterium]|nr:hypothetical protein [Acidobacteriota bacterium]
ILQPRDVAAPAPGFRLGVQPYVSLLGLGYPVDRMRVAVHAGKRPARAVAEAVFLAVHRLDHTVYYRRLRAEEFRLLGALRAGKPIGAAIRLAFRESTVPAKERPALLQAWFASWTGLGWLTALPAAAKGMNS